MKNTIPLSIICDEVSKHFLCEPIDVFSTSRKREIIIRRQWFQYLSRILNPEYIVTSQEIGLYYSDVTGQVFDHATVLHNVKKMKGFVDVYPSFARLKDKLILNIKLANKEIDKDPKKESATPIGYLCSPLKTDLIKPNPQTLCSQNQ